VEKGGMMEMKISKIAIWCFILGSLSLFLPFSIIFAIVGLYLAKEAFVSIKKDNLKGKTFAIIGLVICIISVMMFLGRFVSKYNEIIQKARQAATE